MRKVIRARSGGGLKILRKIIRARSSGGWKILRKTVNMMNISPASDHLSENLKKKLKMSNLFDWHHLNFKNQNEAHPLFLPLLGEKVLKQKAPFDNKIFFQCYFRHFFKNHKAQI